VAGCSAITQSGERCRAIPIDNSQWCYSHHPDKLEERRRHGSKGGKRGGRGRPSTALAGIEDKLEALAESVLSGEVEPSVGAVVVQCRNAQIRAISTTLKAREQEELEQRLEELEAVITQQRERAAPWG
jgi:hypothetical protein